MTIPPTEGPDEARTVEPEVSLSPTVRAEAFSDAVFAIAITLLVLELDAAEGYDTLWAGLVASWPHYVAYLVSFASIGAFWLTHTAITGRIRGIDSTFARINLLLLFVAAFLPFPTRLIAEHLDNLDDERVAVTVYGLTLLAGSVTLGVLWRYAQHAGLLLPGLPDEQVRAITLRTRPSGGLYAAALVFGWFLPRLVVVVYLVIAIFLLIPFHAFAGRRARRSAPLTG